MRHGNNRTFILLDVMFEPRHRLRIEVIRRFIQKQNVRLLKQQTAKGNTPLLAAGQNRDTCFRRRTSQCVHGHFKPGVEIPGLSGI